MNKINKITVAYLCILFFLAPLTSFADNGELASILVYRERNSSWSWVTLWDKENGWQGEGAYNKYLYIDENTNVKIELYRNIQIGTAPFNYQLMELSEDTYSENSDYYKVSFKWYGEGDYYAFIDNDGKGWFYIQEVALPPNAPDDVQVSYNATPEIVVNWDDNSNNETGFIIERKIRGGSYAEIANIGGNLGGYTDSDVLFGNEYKYRVKSYNGAGDSDYSYSNYIIVPAPNTTPTINLTVPSSDITRIQGENVNISWQGDDQDSDDTPTVAIGYDSDNNYANGYNGWLSLSEPESGSFQWDTSSISPGTYYVFGMISDGDDSSYDYASGEVIIQAATGEITESWIKIQWDGVEYNLSVRRNEGYSSITGKSLKGWAKKPSEIIISPDDELSAYEKYQIALAAENILVVKENKDVYTYNLVDYLSPFEQRQDDQHSNCLDEDNRIFTHSKSKLAESMEFDGLYNDGVTGFGGIDNPNVRNSYYVDILISLAQNTKLVANDPSKTECDALNKFIKLSENLSEDNIGILHKLIDKTLEDISKTDFIDLVEDLSSSVSEDKFFNDLQKAEYHSQLQKLSKVIGKGSEAISWGGKVASAVLAQMSINAESYEKLELIKSVLEDDNTLFDKELLCAVDKAINHMHEMEDGIKGYFQCLTDVVLDGKITNVEEFFSASVDKLVEKYSDDVLRGIIKKIGSYLQTSPKTVAMASGAIWGLINTVKSINSSVDICRYMSLSMQLQLELNQWLSLNNSEINSLEDLNKYLKVADVNYELSSEIFQHHLTAIDGHWYSVFMLDPMGGLNALYSLFDSYDDAKNDYESNIKEINTLRNNLSGKFFVTSYEINELLEQLFLGKLPANSDNPNAQLDIISSSSSVKLGEPVEFTVQVSNSGGTAGLSYFDISISNNIQELSISPYEYLTNYNIGNTIYDKNAEEITATNKLYSFVYPSFDGGEEQNYTIQFIPTATGDYWIRLRLSLGVDSANNDFDRFPESGSIDQQGYYVLEYYVIVTDNQSPVITSFSPNNENIELFENDAAVQFSISANDPDGEEELLAITWFLDGNLLSVDDPFGFNPSDFSNGTHTLLAFVDDGVKYAYHQWKIEIIDECAATTWFKDNDSDSFGDPAVSKLACEQPTGYVADNTDCNDADANEHPDQVWYKDADGDGYSDGTVNTTSCGRPVDYYIASELTAIYGDNDDNDNTVHPRAPDIFVTPTNLYFGTVAICGRKPLNLTISNSGDADLLLSTITLSGDDADSFVLGDNPCTGHTVAPGANCTMTVSFSPTSFYAHTAVLTINSNDPDTSVLTIALTGDGVEQIDLTDGLIAHYKFDGNYQDSRDGSFSGVATPAVSFIPDSKGRHDSAIFLADNQNARVALGNRSIINSLGNLFTIAFWTKVEPGNGGMIVEHDVIGTFNYDWKLGCGSTDGKVFFSFGNTSVRSESSIDDGNWHHIAITRDKESGILTFYIDGRSDATITGYYNDLIYSTETNIGPYDTPSGWATNGMVGGLDDLRFYDRILSTDEIELLQSGECGFLNNPADLDGDHDGDGSDLAEMARLMSEGSVSAKELEAFAAAFGIVNY